MLRRLASPSCDERKRHRFDSRIYRSRLVAAETNQRSIEKRKMTQPIRISITPGDPAEQTLLDGVRYQESFLDGDYGECVLEQTSFWDMGKSDKKRQQTTRPDQPELFGSDQ
jgi:hypothetical protein